MNTERMTYQEFLAHAREYAKLQEMTVEETRDDFVQLIRLLHATKKSYLRQSQSRLAQAQKDVRADEEQVMRSGLAVQHLDKYIEETLT